MNQAVREPDGLLAAGDVAVQASFLIIRKLSRIVVIVEERDSHRALEADSIPPTDSRLR